MPDLAWDAAESIVRTTLREAKELGLAVSVAVVDSGRELVGFARQEGAMLVTIQLAIGKAYTACSMGRPTMALAKRTWSGADLYGIELAHDPPLVALGGGAPLKQGGIMVGALGVSGGTVDQDHELVMRVAQAYEDGKLG